MIGQGQATHAAPHGQDQLVEGLDRAVGQPNLAPVAVDGDGLDAQFQGHVQLGPAFRRGQPNRIGLFAGQVFLGQAWTFVGGVRLVADDED
ncbi:hypothetical protein D3C85_869430 [compost metagenome]